MVSIHLGIHLITVFVDVYTVFFFSVCSVLSEAEYIFWFQYVEENFFRKKAA